MRELKEKLESSKKEFMAKLDYWDTPYETGFDNAVEICNNHHDLAVKKLNAAIEELKSECISWKGSELKLEHMARDNREVPEKLVEYIDAIEDNIKFIMENEK